MELITEPDIYSPSMDEFGNYVDKIPSCLLHKNGLRCSCGSRNDKTYNTNSVFAQHIKTKTHIKWLEEINHNKSNYYIENEKLKDTINNQRIIISKLERDLNNKLLTIDYLTQQLNKHSMIQSSANNINATTANLLDFD